MRCFLALTLPPHIRERLAELQGRLSAQRTKVKWVAPAQMHVTLKFFGDLSEMDRPRVEAVGRDLCAGASPIPLGVRGAGSFGPPSAPRVIWAGLLDEQGRLVPFQKSLEEALGAAGIPPEPRPFSPHLTLGRIRDPRWDDGLRAALQGEASFEGGRYVADRLTLYASVLGPSGPIYSALRTWLFGGLDGN